MTSTFLTSLRLRESGVVFWALALGILCLAALAPTRPWGWTGEAYLMFALFAAVAGWRGAGGVPRREQWRGVVVLAALFVAANMALRLVFAAV